MMGVVYLNYYVPGLCTSSDVLKNTTFRKLDLFPTSVIRKGASVGSARKLTNPDLRCLCCFSLYGLGRPVIEVVMGRRE
jgi:hypothetical protein